MSTHIIIIGGGQAALSCAAKLRSLDKKTKHSIAGGEPHAPYQRPPLSKKYLAGKINAERLNLRPPEWYVENNIEIYLGSHVINLNRHAKTITLDNTRSLAYSHLVFATGSKPRTLPQYTTSPPQNLYTVRSRDDIDLMRHEFIKGRKLLLIGGGYIGLEIAAVAQTLGLNVMIAEAAPRILNRVACKTTADFFRQLHLKNSVNIIENTLVEKLHTKNSRITGATLNSNRTVDTDFVIAGIGIIPNSEIAENAGILCQDGITVDEYCRTNDPLVYAAGDCSSIHYQGKIIRIESVGNAVDQGEIVAANIIGENNIYNPKPWFWSEQYNLTLQIAGLNINYDETVTRPGSKNGTLSVWYYQKNKLIAVDAIGEPRTYMIGKSIIENNKNLPKHIAENPNIDLKNWTENIKSKQ
jgi:3-phenylpropionate/trans-cinnamate dioxygenase ferredoxin reductase subunit